MGKCLYESTGNAASAQPQSLGVYKYYQEYAGRAAYYGPVNLHRSNRIFYSAQYKGWMIGDKLGSYSAYIYNPSPQAACPYMIPAGWQYFSGNLWYVDPTLILRCIPS